MRDEATECAARGAVRGSGATGVYACVVERALQRLVHALGVPRRQRVGAGGDNTPVSAPGGGAVWGGKTDEDPCTGRLGGIVQDCGGTLGGTAAPARGSACGGRGEHDDGAIGDRASAGVSDRGGDRGVLSGGRLRAHRCGGGRGVWTGDRAGTGASAGLQVGTAGAVGATRDRGELRDRRRRGAAAQPDVRDGGEGRRTGVREGPWQEQEARRAGGCPRGRRRTGKRPMSPWMYECD